ncbi:glycosyltransferase [Arthrobacter sp. MDB2-24]
MTSRPDFDIVVSLGTDHHRFDRLVEWVDGWLQDQPDPPSCLVQYGSSSAPIVAEGVELLSREQMVALYAAAKVVVVQGGPGSIFDARSVGQLPVAVPRRAAFQEVVDDHQVAFCRQLHQEGEVILVESEEELTASLHAALTHPHSVKKPSRESQAPAAAAALRKTVDHVVSRRAGILSLQRALEIVKRKAATPE